MSTMQRFRAGLAGVTALAGAASAQDGTFRTWFEAPDTVLAGEAFEVEMWASFEGDLLRPEGWLSGIASSLEVGGNLNVFGYISEVETGLAFVSERGTPDGPWLRDVITLQALMPGVTIDNSNPIRALTFEIGTLPEGRGVLNVDLRSHSGYALPFLGWNVVGLGDFATTVDPNVALIVTPATVRVVPAPLGVVLLALGGFAPVRRRR